MDAEQMDGDVADGHETLQDFFWSREAMQNVIRMLTIPSWKEPPSSVLLRS